MAQSSASVSTRLQNRDEYLTVGEFAREFGTSEQNTYLMVRQGRIPHIRFSNRIYIHRDTLDTFLLSREISSTATSTEGKKNV